MQIRTCDHIRGSIVLATKSGSVDVDGQILVVVPLQVSRQNSSPELQRFP